MAEAQGMVEKNMFHNSFEGIRNAYGILHLDLSRLVVEASLLVFWTHLDCQDQSKLSRTDQLQALLFYSFNGIFGSVDGSTEYDFSILSEK